ncbi:MAG: ribosome maturation factor RimP [Clostridia bacterium]|nr:ribosome maturation factor RimP [Clostridia bacterium]
MQKSGKDYFLRIYIDSEKGIDLTDCEKTNNAINDILDEADYIKTEYFLEVSSPGVEKVLRKDNHLAENIGVDIEIKLFKPINKEKALTGALVRFDKEKIYIQVNSEEISVDRTQIAQIKTKYNW